MLAAIQKSKVPFSIATNVVFRSGQTNDSTIKTSDTVLGKIHLSLYLKGLCVRESWRPNRTATYQRFFPIILGCSTGGPEAQLSAGCCFLYSVISLTLLELQNSLIGGSEAPSAGAGFLYHILSPNSLNFQRTELYNSLTSTQYLPITGHWNMHFRRLWNGVFDRHRAEITVMQFTGHSLPFVTVPSSPTPMEYATSADFGMACLARSEVNIQHYSEM